MKEIFNKYFKHFPTIFYFATIMDPRIKFEGCKYLHENIYEKMNYPNCFLAWNDIEYSIICIIFMILNLKINNHPSLHHHISLKVLYYLVYYLHPKDQEAQSR